MKLRDYQQDLVDSVWNKLHGKNKVLVVAPCGAGKTECFIDLCRRAIEDFENIRIVILLNKVDLVEQTARRISKVIPSVGVICSTLNKFEEKRVIVASIQTVKDYDFDKINLIIADEVHNFSEKEGSSYDVFFKKNNHEKLKIVGFTATPYRPSGYLYGEGKLFDKVDHEVSFQELFNKHYLVVPKMKASAEEFDTKKIKITNGDFDNGEIAEMCENAQKACAQIKDAMPKLKDREKIAWACATIKHAEIVKSELELMGETCSIVHSKQKRDQQLFEREFFENGNNRHLIFVSMLSEGIDIPKIDTLCLLRPTRSVVRYIQTVGRALRPFEGKEDALILDYGQVVKNCGPITKPFIFEKGQKRSKEELMKVCKECAEIIERSLRECPSCGFEFVPKPKPVIPRLEKMSESKVNILGKKQVNEIEIDAVKFRIHKSKAGNNCFTIDFCQNHFPFKKVSEFYVWENQYARKRLTQRLLQLQCPFYSKIEEQVKSSPAIYPKKIVTEFDGKYENIVRLVF